MALANAHTTEYASVLEMEPGGPAPRTPLSHCDIAIDALDRALNAIACDEIEARCSAVGTATEATTALFLELDSIDKGALAQDAGRIYQSILMRLVRINLHNDPKMVRETIAIIERLRDACARRDDTDPPPARAAAHLIGP